MSPERYWRGYCTVLNPFIAPVCNISELKKGARARARTHTHTHARTRTHARSHTHTHTHTRTRTHTHTRTRTHAHTHALTHTHTHHTHTHARTQRRTGNKIKLSMENGIEVRMTNFKNLPPLPRTLSLPSPTPVLTSRKVPKDKSAQTRMYSTLQDNTT